MKTRQYIRFAAALALWGLLMPQTLFSEEERFVHRASRDTISWISVEKGRWWMIPRDTDIEWPGEQLGLIGPIIAHGGQGKEAYIAVYDPAGVLVGAITKKDAKKNPERLEAIIRIAQKRAIIQNQYGLISIGMKAKVRETPETDTKNQ
jgi:hypothetical protein